MPLRTQHGIAAAKIEKQLNHELHELHEKNEQRLVVRRLPRFAQIITDAAGVTTLSDYGYMIFAFSFL